MKKHIAIIAAVGVLGLCRSSYGMATEQIGPDTRHPTVSQQDWPKGIVGIPRHLSRVYSIWVNGNENFYFKCKVDEINELLALFAAARMRDHVVRIEPGVKKASTFDKEEIEYNVRLQIVAGIVLSFAREKLRDDLPLEPRLTILTGDDDSLVNQLKWPENLIVESEIPSVAINSNMTKAKRKSWYGHAQFEDLTPATDIGGPLTTQITLWEKDVEGGIKIAKVDNKGFFNAAFSDEEITDLKMGISWLTITTGNWLTEAKKDDTKFPVEMLSLKKENLKPVIIRSPKFYYGRILFEDGSPPVIDPEPWPGAEIMVDFRYAGSPQINSQGYFKVFFTKEQYEKAKAQKVRKNIYIPDYSKKGRSTARFAFPLALLSQDKTKAGVVKIPRPKLPKQPLTTAESKVGKAIPGFDNIRFEVFQKNQTKGKPLLVCFWDMDQRPSRQYIRVLEKQKQALRDKNIVILAVHSGTKRGKQVKDWLSKNGPSLTVGMIQGDPYDTLLAWGARGSPWLVLTDEKHIITKAGFSLNDLSLVNWLFHILGI